MGAVLQQYVDNMWQPLCFFSRKLNSSQRKYSPYDRELLAIYEAVKYFRHMVEARHFTIFTDHKPIIYAFQQRRDKCSPRQFNQLDFISQFTTDIRHVSGQQNVVADALSRIEEISTPIDYAALARSQENDEELRSLLENGSSLQLEQVPVPGAGMHLYCDTSNSRPRPFVTKLFRRHVFDALHGLSHPGANATTKLISQRFV